MNIMYALALFSDVIGMLNALLAIPAMILFFAVAVYLTIRTRFIQIRAFPYFISLIKGGVAQTTAPGTVPSKTITPFHALFTAMATTIGMGNVVGPSVAVVTGGPGALFWLLFYMFFGAVTKFVEVTYALETRTRAADGYIFGGPMQYLKSVSPFLSYWYSCVMVFLFIGWSSLQSNTLANIFHLESIPMLEVPIPKWFIGVALAFFVLISLRGGAQRVGRIMSKLVPTMFVFYVSFALLILLQDPAVLWQSIRAIFSHILTPMAPVGGFLGATIFQAMSSGVSKGIYISEAGVGTSSIPHAIADSKNPTDQGILAMGSMIADATLSLISGLLVIVTGIWAIGDFRSTLIYEAFKLNSYLFGQVVLLISLTLFVVTTVVGNSFNGTRCFAWLTNHRWEMSYIGFTVSVIFLGALVPMPLMWQIMDLLLVMVAIPNLLGLLVLVHKRPHSIKF